MCNFIKRVKIKNFFSIKNEVELDFFADEYTIENHKDRVFEYNGNYFNKIKAIYGANASGKTTFLKSIVFLSFLISNKTESLPIHHTNIYNNENESAYIEVEFVYNGEVFKYYVEFEKREGIIIGIKNEILKIYKENKFLKLIDRKEKVVKDLNQKEIKDLLFEKISIRKSLIAELSSRTNDYDGIISFFKGIVVTSNIKGSYNVALQLMADENLLLASLFDESLISKTLSLFNEININKIGFYKFLINVLNQLNIDIKDVKSNINIKKITPFQNDIEIEFKTIHKINENKSLPFNLESHGTQMIFRLLFDLYYAYTNKSVVIIDELDAILHPLIVPYFNFLAIFNDIQFIYSTHNIYNLKYLYKDEFVFIEKDELHNTKIIDPKKDNKIKGFENLLKLYEENVLGGVPKIKDLKFNIKA